MQFKNTRRRSSYFTKYIASQFGFLGSGPNSRQNPVEWKEVSSVYLSLSPFPLAFQPVWVALWTL